MRLPVGVVDVVDVVGGDDFETKLGGDLEQVGDDAALLFNAVIHDLDDEELFAEDIDEFGAASRACSNSPSSRNCGMTAARQPENPIRPSLYLASVSRSVRGLR